MHTCVHMQVMANLLTSMLSDSHPALRSLRVLRVLRPVRLIARFEGLRVTVTLLFEVMPAVVEVHAHAHMYTCAHALLFEVMPAVVEVHVHAHVVM